MDDSLPDACPHCGWAELYGVQEYGMEILCGQLNTMETLLTEAEARALRLTELLAQVFTEDMHMNHEASHPTCNACGQTWGHRVELIDKEKIYSSDSWREYDIPEQHDSTCWVLKARSALALIAPGGTE